MCQETWTKSCSGVINSCTQLCKVGGQVSLAGGGEESSVPATLLYLKKTRGRWGTSLPSCHWPWPPENPPALPWLRWGCGSRPGSWCTVSGTSWTSAQLLPAAGGAAATRLEDNLHLHWNKTKKRWLKRKSLQGASLVAQRQRIRLSMWETGVPSLIRDDPTCHGATRPMGHNYCACMPWLLKPACSRARAPQPEKLPQRNWRAAPACWN